MRRHLTALILAAVLTGIGYLLFPSFFQKQALPIDTATSSIEMKSKLSPEAYDVMYQGGTERPFSSPLDFETRKGTYVSADTGLPLFRSEDKYDSGTGWPSFVKPINMDSIILKVDSSLGISRTEVLTKDTHAHLGHVFDDGPKDRGGKRYCMNGVALVFIPDSAPVE